MGVDIHHGINYGGSVGGSRLWPGAGCPRKIFAPYDFERTRFARRLIVLATTQEPWEAQRLDEKTATAR